MPGKCLHVIAGDQQAASLAPRDESARPHPAAHCLWMATDKRSGVPDIDHGRFRGRLGWRGHVFDTTTRIAML